MPRVRPMKKNSGSVVDAYCRVELLRYTGAVVPFWDLQGLLCPPIAPDPPDNAQQDLSSSSAAAENLCEGDESGIHDFSK